MSGVKHYRFHDGLACGRAVTARTTTTTTTALVTCKRCKHALEGLEWWKTPSDDDARAGAYLLELTSEEIHALIEYHMGERWVTQKMLEHPGDDAEQTQRHERWLSYHQAKIRQFKMLEAEASKEGSP